MLNTSHTIRACLLGLSLLTGSVASAEGGDGASGFEPAPSFDGRYKLAASDAQKEARQKSVDTTVGEFFVLTRPIARKKLEAKTHTAEWVTIKESTGKVTIQFEGREPEVCPLEGSSKGKDPDGNDAQFAAKLNGDTLVQTVTTEEGKRTNTFKLQDNGSIKVTVELTSKKFETPIKYTLSYAPSR